MCSSDLKAVPDAIVGAGTVLNETQLQEALRAGSQFVVSPGFSASLVSAAQSLHMPALPGCVTATEVMMALDSGLSVRLEPQIGPGMRVLIRHGALRGLEGWVEDRHGLSEVLLRLDFIGQAAAVRVDAEHLELT